MEKIRIDIRPQVYLMAAVLLLILPLRWLMGWILAAVVHELCHIYAVRVLGGQIYAMKIVAGGAEIELSPMDPWQEFLCAMAGPAGGLLLVLFFPWLPCTGFFALFQSLYNLMPLYPLDGGRAIQCILRKWFGDEKAERFLSRAEDFLISGLLIFGILGMRMWNLGTLPLLMGLGFVLRKIPCKRAALRLQ